METRNSENRTRKTKGPLRVHTGLCGNRSRALLFPPVQR